MHCKELVQHIAGTQEGIACLKLGVSLHLILIYPSVNASPILPTVADPFAMVALLG